MKRAIETGVRVLLVAAIAGLAGCTQRLGDFTVLSTKNVSIKGNRGDRVKGQSCMNMVLFIPVGAVDLKVAVDKAIEGAGPGFDALEDAVLSSRTIFLLFFTQSCMIVEGTSISTKGGGASLHNDKFLYHSSLINDSNRNRQEEALRSLAEKAVTQKKG